MSDNVTPIRPDVVPLASQDGPAEPVQNVVASLEAMLAAAKSGELRLLIAVAQYADLSTSNYYAGGVSLGALGAVQLASRHLEDWLLEEALSSQPAG